MDKVIFRKWPDGDIIALFPDVPYSAVPDHLIQSYMHTGQHGAAHKDLINDLEPPSQQECNALMIELTCIGYDLKVVETW